MTTTRTATCNDCLEPFEQTGTPRPGYCPNCAGKRGVAPAIPHGAEYHSGDCRVIVGPRGGETVKISRWRVSGRPIPARSVRRGPITSWELPVKFGLRLAGRVTLELDGRVRQYPFGINVHAAGDCPLG